MKQESLVEIKNLKKYYLVKNSVHKEKRKYLKAVDNVSLNIQKEEVLGLVGESGCGKSTLGHTLLRLNGITSGSILFDGEDITGYSGKRMRELREKMQIIFQDPYASLNPRMTVFDAIAAPLKAFKIGRREEYYTRVRDAMKVVGLSEQQMYKYPHEMSGGQRQRVVIARSLIIRPKFIVCDESVSALDVSVRSQVLNLMKDIKEEYGITYLFISHDLAVIRYLCDRIAVMYLGKIVELADKEELFCNPLHPYTKALLSAIPVARVDKNKSARIILSGDLPSPVNPPLGCGFHTRCTQCAEQCMSGEVVLREVAPKHFAACHFA